MFTIVKQITDFCFLAKWHQHWIDCKVNTYKFHLLPWLFSQVDSCTICLSLSFSFCLFFFSPSSLCRWICLAEHAISLPRNRKHWIWGKYSDIPDTAELLFFNLVMKVTVESSWIHLFACLEVQAALYRIAGYSGDHSRGEGFQTRPVASQEASGWSLESSARGLLPESLEDPAEGRKESHCGFLF